MRKPKGDDRIVLTGGHAATTALAVVAALREDSQRAWDITWIGSARAVEGKKALSLEFKVFPEYGVTCREIVTGRVQRRWSRFTITSLLKIPVGFVHAFSLLLRIRPKAVISFGGFAAFPVVAAAYALRIPVILHEQTMAVGLANKLSSPFARKIAVSRKESMAHFPSRKTVLSGNPVRKEFFRVGTKKTIGRPPRILVMGGSRGSEVVNSALVSALPSLLRDFSVTHLAGEIDYERVKGLRGGLPKKLLSRYRLLAGVSPLDMPKLYKEADIVVSRAGANTVSEVMAVSRPSIFIPIPWSRYGEQAKNAQIAASAGLSLILSQDELSGDALVSAIAKVRKNWKKMNSATVPARELDRKAATNLVKLVEEVLG